MNTIAVVLEKPEQLVLRQLDLEPSGDEDVVVDIEWSGISTGTERLLWSGRMPPFPGMGYPLVPGYESVGRVREVGSRAGRSVGDRVFVPGARCYGDVRGLFGGAAARVVVPGSRGGPGRRAAGRAGGSAGPGRHRVSRSVQSGGAATGSHRRPRRARASPRAAGAGGGCRATNGLGAQPEARDGCRRLPRGRSRHGRAPRLPHRSTT